MSSQRGIGHGQNLESGRKDLDRKSEWIVCRVLQPVAQLFALLLEVLHLVQMAEFSNARVKIGKINSSFSRFLPRNSWTFINRYYYIIIVLFCLLVTSQIQWHSIISNQLRIFVFYQNKFLFWHNVLGFQIKILKIKIVLLKFILIKMTN